MENKFTKGRWVLNDDNSSVVSRGANISGNIICKAPEFWPDSMEYWDANAKLIAAAPDLLAACQAALRHHQGGHSEIGGILKEAIKKATE